MTIQACELDFSTPVRSGTGEGVTEDGKVDACIMQRAWLRDWCREHPGGTFRDLVDEPIPDSHPTVSPILTRFTISLNDGLPDAQRQRLAAYDERLLGTKTTDEDEERRAWLCTDWIVRTFAPTWLRKAGLVAEADALLALPELTSTELAEAATPIITTAKESAAWAAWAAWAARDAWDARDAGSDSVLAIAYAAAKDKPSYDEARAAAEAALGRDDLRARRGAVRLARPPHRGGEGCGVIAQPPVRIVSKCPVCRLYNPPTRDPDWHLTTQSHKANGREPERRVRAGTRAERGSER